MGMSNRLLRPRQSLHPEAASWAARVSANGGAYSASTIKAVNQFCKDIDAARIRDRFFRLNLFCGTGLNACLVPLYRGQSLSATQHGSSTDTNVGGLFVAGDYTETAAGAGLVGNGSNKYLNTGFAHDTLQQNDSHVACYEITRASATFRVSIGCRATSATGNLILATWASTANYSALPFQTSSVLNLASSAGGFYLCSVNGSADTALYRNGGSKVTSPATTRTPGNQSIFVFALNDGGSVSVPTDARLGGYSFGLKMTDAQAASFNTAMQTFQAALGRSVA